MKKQVLKILMIGMLFTAGCGFAPFVTMIGVTMIGGAIVGTQAAETFDKETRELWEDSNSSIVQPEELHIINQ